MQKERAEYFRAESEKLINELHRVLDDFSEKVNQHIVKLRDNYEEDFQRSTLTFGHYIPYTLDQDICKTASKECSNIVLRFANLVFGYSNEHPLNTPLKKALELEFHFPGGISFENGQFQSEFMNPDSYFIRCLQKDISSIEYLINEFIIYLDSFVLPFIEEATFKRPK